MAQLTLEPYAACLCWRFPQEAALSHANAAPDLIRAWDRFLELEPELVEQLRTDDQALLEFGFRWLRFALFAEPTMKVREEHQTTRGES